MSGGRLGPTVRSVDDMRDQLELQQPHLATMVAEVGGRSMLSSSGDLVETASRLERRHEELGDLQRIVLARLEQAIAEANAKPSSTDAPPWSAAWRPPNSAYPRADENLRSEIVTALVTPRLLARVLVVLGTLLIVTALLVATL
jgi:hypothetical protein